MGWLGTWAKRKAIKYGTTKPGSSLTDFPLLIQISADSDLGTSLGATPKLALTLADGTTAVNHGRISWSYSGGNVTANIRAKFSPTSSASTGDVLGYIYYDSAQTDTESKSGVLDSNTKGYWPLEEDPSGSAPQILDWSSNANNGTSSGMSSGDLVTSQVANGLSLGSTKYVNMPDAASLDLVNTFSMSFTANIATFNTGSTAAGVIISKFDATGANGVDKRGIRLEGGSTDLLLVTESSTNRITIAAATVEGLHRHCLVSSSGGSIYYIDGTQVATGAQLTSWFNSSNGLRLGASIAGFFYSSSGSANVVLDELFLDSTNRSANWIAYDYQNQFNNSNTVTLGVEEANSSGGGGSIIGDGNLLDGSRLFNGRIAA